MSPTGSHPSSASNGPAGGSPHEAVAPRRRGRRPTSRWWLRRLAVPAVLSSSMVVMGTAPLASGQPDDTASEARFPATIVDDERSPVHLPSPAERVVSLTPGTTEILFAIGAGDRVIATTDADDHPPEAVPLPDVGSFGSIDIERIVELDPDLVIAGGNGYTPPEDIARLRALGYPVLVVYADSVDAVIGDVELLGQAVGESRAAAEAATSMREGFASLSELVDGRPRPRVFYEIDASVELYGPADESFLAEMVELAGGEPITSGSAMSFAISLERLIEADPEVIVLGDAAYGTTPGLVAARPGWAGMTAVREGAIRPVEDVLVTRPGPRLVEGLRDLIEAIHPDALP